MYQSLIRPIITYACSIWFNISASNMEKIRIFERKCLRACTSLYRSSEVYKSYLQKEKLSTPTDTPTYSPTFIKSSGCHCVFAALTLKIHASRMVNCMSPVPVSKHHQHYLFTRQATKLKMSCIIKHCNKGNYDITAKQQKKLLINLQIEHKHFF
ncbi:hypothetical protein FF38_04214 [Lucilia cuprina]|uniref:Uncharacterized protein n=1 Tax=Lucilia cuprina TaxID=7375 RepID=A0A0L0BLB2_LUCCU|nr:hypothetical protein FF38_04214 [Lucilia cuprina]